MLKNVERSTLAAQVTAQLERMIVGGEWVEGTRIPAEPELMEQLGVSRNTVREAVRALTHIGLLEARPGDGTYVRSTSVLAASVARRLEGCTVREILEARECLEREAAGLAARRRTAEELAELERGWRAVDRAFAAGEPLEALTTLAFEEHRRLLHASHNPLLIELYESLADSVRHSIGASIASFLASGADPEPPRRLHRELIDAIAAGDAAAAERVAAAKSRWVLSVVDGSAEAAAESQNQTAGSP